EADLRDRHEPVDHLGLPGLRADLRDARRPPDGRLLHDGGLRVREVVRGEPVRARLRDRARDGADHALRHLLLHPRDGADRGGSVIAVETRGRRLRQHRRRRLARRVGWNALALAVFLVMVFPVYWMVSTAFKQGPDILSYTPKWFPAPATLSHF